MNLDVVTPPLTLGGLRVFLVIQPKVRTEFAEVSVDIFEEVCRVAAAKMVI